MSLKQMIEHHPMRLLFTDVQTNERLKLKHQQLVLTNLFSQFGTPMSINSTAYTLRKVFITHNIDRFEKGKDIFRTHTLAEFIQNLAKQVNTSVLQLTSTYFLRQPIDPGLQNADEEEE